MDQLLEINLLMTLHLVSTAAMTGLIWTIQLVHYPSFHFINIVVYEEFQKFHMQRISIVVMPLMILEFITGLLLLVLSQEQFFLVNFVLIVMIWLSTFLLSVPEHSKLEKGYNHKAVDRLVSTNWVRTLLWSVRLVLLTCWFF